MHDNNRPEWLRSRGYVHVSDKINQATLSLLEKKIRNPNWVAKHGFFPLLKKGIKTRRYKKLGYDEHGKAKRSHYDHKKNESNAKVRDIEYATHIDTAIFSYYAKEVLGPQYEAKLIETNGLSDCITAYRRVPVDESKIEGPNKSNIHFASEVFNYIVDRGECAVLAFDVEKFFPSLNHKRLKSAWAKLFDRKNLADDEYAVLKAATKYSWIELNQFRKHKPKGKGKKLGFDEKSFAKQRRIRGSYAFFESAAEMRQAIKSGEIRLEVNDKGKGIPHGLPISSTLANLYMLEFDKLILTEICQKYHAFYRRYSDDIIVVCNKEDYLVVKEFVENCITQYELKISSGKTEVCFFEKDAAGEFHVTREITTMAGNKLTKPNMPLVYLGFEFYGNMTLIKSANLAKFYRRMKTAIKTQRKNAQKAAINKGEESAIVYNRKLKRIYTHLGAKSKKWPIDIVQFKRNELYGHFDHEVLLLGGEKTYRGNTLSYAYRAHQIMPRSKIKGQFSRHWKIFWKKLLEG